MAQRNLAQYFEHTEDAKRTNDRWLSDHFYSRCLETGSMVNSLVFVATVNGQQLLIGVDMARSQVTIGARKGKHIAMWDWH